MEKIELPKVRDLGQVVGDPFLFARQNFGFFVRAFLYYSFPALLLAVGLTAFGLKGVFAGKSSFAESFAQGDFWGSSGLGSAIIIAYLIFILASLFQQIYISEFMVLKEHQEEVTNEEVLQQLKLDWKVILATFLVMIPLGIGALILMVLVIQSSDYLGDYVAGFIAFLLYLFFFYCSIPLSNLLFVRLRERLSLSESIVKSFRITNGNWWSTFVGWLLVFLVFYMLLAVLMLPFSMLNWIIKFHSLSSGYSSGGESLNNSVLGVAATLGVFAFFFIMNLFHIFIGINYYSLSEKYDNYHLRAEINRIGDREDQNIRKQEGEF